jgi:CRP-like cAMP-binding protein
MARKDARKLKEAAQAAVDKGKWARALEAYLELEEAEPADGQWCRRAADCHRRLGQRAEEVLALMRGVEKYSRAGFVVKAVALCKMILAIDPEHAASKAALAEFSAAQGIAFAPKPAAPPPPSIPSEGAAERRPSRGANPPPAPPAPAPLPRTLSEGPAEQDPSRRAAPRSRTIPPNATLDEVALRELVPGSREVQKVSEVPSGIFEIPIDDVELVVDEQSSERDAAEQAARDAFRKTPLLSELQPALLAELVDRVGLVELGPGDVLFEQGDPATALYVVAEGAVAVLAEGPPRVQLARLGEGEFFGEIGLMTRAPRRATVEAAEPTQLIRIDMNAIGELVERDRRVLQVLLRFLRDRLIDGLVKTSPLFEPFGGDERAGLAGKFRFLETDRDAVLVAQGDRADGLYVLLTGRAEVVREVDGQPRRLATLEAGDLCGEMSLLAHEPAVATVRTTGKCFVLQLPAAAFREVIMTHPQVLMFVGDLADQRRRANAAVADGTADYAEGHLDLL